MSDVWVHTGAGLIRADRIVQVMAAGNKLQVGIDVQDQAEVGGPELYEVTPLQRGEDTRVTAEINLARMIAAVRGRRGIIIPGNDLDGSFSFQPFPDPNEG